MSSTVLVPQNDPMGQAIYEYHKTGKAEDVIVHSSMFDDDIIPVETLFRNFDQMPDLEKAALEMASGDILDIGAGSGCHSLALKSMGKEPVAIDISPLSVAVMAEKGIDARLVNLSWTKEREVGAHPSVVLDVSGLFVHSLRWL